MPLSSMRTGEQAESHSMRNIFFEHGEIRQRNVLQGKCQHLILTPSYWPLKLYESSETFESKHSQIQGTIQFDG